MNDPKSPLPAQLRWRKSSSSQGENDCVEVAAAPDGGWLVRDSKNPELPPHQHGRRAWTAFLDGLTHGTLRQR